MYDGRNKFGLNCGWFKFRLSDDRRRLRDRILSASFESMCDGSTGTAIFVVLRVVKAIYGLHSSNCVSSLITLQRAWCV